jgi:hypothetical protein
VLSLVFWAWLLGPLGAFLAVPLTLLVKAMMVDADPQAHWLRPLISSPDELPTDETDEPPADALPAAAPGLDPAPQTIRP